MAYDSEKNRMAAEITQAVGINRTRDGALEREATERAYEARQQTGLEYDGPQDIITHPSATQRQQRLGVPSSVSTAELATWNYRYTDPIGAATNGLLQSRPHREVLDNPTYDYWGFGIYTEMPPNTDAELERRWWIVIWLASEDIGGAVEAKPKEVFPNGMPVQFSRGTYTGYKFSHDGKVLGSKDATWAKARSFPASGRGPIPNHGGTYLRIAGGALADYWVKERGFWALRKPEAQ